MTSPRSSDFTRFLGAHGLANLGDGVLLLAVPWLVSLATRDPLVLATADAMLTLPWLIAAVPAGVLVDRVASRGRLVVRVSAGQALGMAALAGLVWAWDAGRVGSTPFLVILMATTALVGCIEVIRDLTNHTLVPLVIESNELTRANGRMGAVEVAANQFAGGPVGGVLLGMAAAAPFVLNATLFTLGAILVASVPRLLITRGSDVPVTVPRWGMWAEAKEGFGTFNRIRIVRSFTVMICASNGLDAAVFATFVFYAQEVLGISAAALGTAYAAGALGAIVGGVAVDRIVGWIGEGPAVLMGIMSKVLLFGAIVAAPSTVAIALVMAACGLALGPVNALSRAVRQAVVPDARLGRVTAVHRLLAWGVLPLGSIAGGLAVTLSISLFDLPRELALRVPAAGALIVGVMVSVVAARSLTTTRIRRALASAPDAATTD